ncbi:hypothetical protein [Kangiella sediminilitoris]|uniref:DUF4426 domain-containing protein n=1 Tax=Kangiella sediminilitoris TaxID=1144748 RepID=A0A1B3BDA1_9GAMM|nr:hypothetical protein [Kangiella sediminilitoris]AOE50796.1 hypothetical protein KS2013_2091 [Kangiella sediminilitoris]
MNLSIMLKNTSLGIIAATALTMAAVSHADQPTEPLENVKLFGVVDTVNETSDIQRLQPTSSSITQEHNDGLTVLTLSQTFINNSDSELVGYYHLPLPNPGALLNYEVTSSQDKEALSEPQQLTLQQGESITYKVRYELNPQLLVGFHQTVQPEFSPELMETSIAQN